MKPRRIAHRRSKRPSARTKAAFERTPAAPASLCRAGRPNFVFEWRKTSADDRHQRQRFDFRALLHPGTVFEHPKDVVSQSGPDAGRKARDPRFLGLQSFRSPQCGHEAIAEASEAHGSEIARFFGQRQVRMR